MSFEFSELIIPENNQNQYFSDLVIPEGDNDAYDYCQFLSDPIYDWLNIPEEVEQVCDQVEEEKKKPKKVTIIQQPQPSHTLIHKRVSYRRGPYRKKIESYNHNCKKLIR